LQAAWKLYDKRGEYTIAVSAVNGADIGWFYFGRTVQVIDGEPLWTSDTRIYPIDASRAIDINTPEDWARAEDAYRVMHRRSA
jgi:CMP-N-acetylneuraminic acid synthetase